MRHGYPRARACHKNPPMDQRSQPILLAIGGLNGLKAKMRREDHFDTITKQLRALEDDGLLQSHIFS